MHIVEKNVAMDNGKAGGCFVHFFKIPLVVKNTHLTFDH